MYIQDVGRDTIMMLDILSAVAIIAVPAVSWLWVNFLAHDFMIANRRLPGHEELCLRKGLTRS